MWVAIHFVLILLLAAAGIAAPWIGPILNLQPPSTGAFTGALISSAAVMLGTLLVRQQTRDDKKSADSERRNSIKTLVAAELVNVAAGYIQLRETMNAAMKTLSSGGSISMLTGLSPNMPRSMPFTSAADSDEVAQGFRFDGAHHSEMIAPITWSLAGG